MNRCTVSSVTPISADTMFLQIVKHYTPFLALHQFFHTLPIIWADIVNIFCKIKKKFPARQHYVEQNMLIVTAFNPPLFSLDNTFKAKRVRQK